jgi:hypothetical protein
MALADYRLCDQCGNKAFYDARLNYDVENGVTVLDHLGTWAVLCVDCAKTHETVVLKRGEVNAALREALEALAPERAKVARLRVALHALVDAAERQEHWPAKKHTAAARLVLRETGGEP